MGHSSLFLSLSMVPRILLEQRCLLRGMSTVNTLVLHCFVATRPFRRAFSVWKLRQGLSGILYLPFVACLLRARPFTLSNARGVGHISYPGDGRRC
jgi:hypothetical protein